MIDYKNYITIEPGKRSGQACIRGMRITVADVLAYLASGMTIEAIQTLKGFPPKIIWLRCGNVSTTHIIGLLQDKASEIIAFLEDNSSGIIEIR